MRKPTLAHQLAELSTLLEPTRGRLYEYVAREMDPVTRDQAAQAMGITRSKAAFHLDVLVDAGLLRVQFRRLSGRTGRGAGRPSKLYARSRHRFSITVPQQNPELLARLLAPAVQGASQTLTQDAAHRYGESLGAKAKRRLGRAAGDERLARCIDEIAESLGFEPTRSGAETWARNCPFDPLSRDVPQVVCHTALAILGGVIEGVGASRVRPTRRERPPWCCVVLQHLPEPS
jgi:predicted ArsR family transcriptional regulator